MCVSVSRKCFKTFKEKYLVHSEEVDCYQRKQLKDEKMIKCIFWTLCRVLITFYQKEYVHLTSEFFSYIRNNEMRTSSFEFCVMTRISIVQNMYVAAELKNKIKSMYILY